MITIQWHILIWQDDYETKGNKVSAANEYQYALDLNKLYPEIDDDIIQERLFKLLKHKFTKV